jgi:hypothetical protein
LSGDVIDSYPGPFRTVSSGWVAVWLQFCRPVPLVRSAGDADGPGQPGRTVEDESGDPGTGSRSQAELIASLRRRIDILERRRPGPDQRLDLAGILAAGNLNSPDSFAILSAGNVLGVRS